MIHQNLLAIPQFTRNPNILPPQPRLLKSILNSLSNGHLIAIYSRTVNLPVPSLDSERDRFSSVIE